MPKTGPATSVDISGCWYAMFDDDTVRTLLPLSKVGTSHIAAEFVQNQFSLQRHVNGPNSFLRDLYRSRPQPRAKRIRGKHEQVEN